MSGKQSKQRRVEDATSACEAVYASKGAPYTPEVNLQRGDPVRGPRWERYYRREWEFYHRMERVMDDYAAVYGEFRGGLMNEEA